MARMTSGGSPKKLQRSVWNQLQALPSSQSQAAVPSLALSLRNISLSPPQHKPLPSSSSSYSSSSSSQHPYFPSRLLTVIHSQCQLRSPLIRTLDLSYSVLDSRTLAELCSWCSKLEVLTAANCGLQGTEKSTRWPSQLRRLDLSRNKLPLIPKGFSVLLCLEKLNLSGNCISYLDPPLLKLPHLQRLYLLKNPIRNVPKTICLGSIDEMRDFLHILPLPVPPNTISFPHPPNVSILNPVSQSPRNRVESVESGYHSEGTLTSIGSNSSLDTEGGRSKCDSITSPAWPKFCRSHIPYGYSEGQSSRCNLCQVFLPPGTPDCVEVKEVRDLSLHPKLPTNQLLITAVVQVSPHGMTFSQDKPAILVLPHCTRPNPHCTEDIVVLCSETTHYQRPQWKQMSEKVGCDLYEECVAFSTTHFSLFTVASVMPYHSASLVISSNEGGRLTVPECPGLEVQIPAGSLSHCEESTITATVYYSDPPTLGHLDGPDSTLSLASPIVGLEPHGIYFLQPVTVSLPVSDYFTIVSSIPEASLQLWTASPSVEALHWSCLNNADLSIHPSNGASHTVSFSVSHFSFFELLWTLCQDSLTRLGTGASLVYSSLRTHYVSIRCQVFMTPPLPDLTFALLVVVYKFGEKLSQLGNYPWLLADSGDRRIFLQTGDLEVELDGCFEPRRECGEKELRQRQILKFAGQDFSLRFAFALKLNSLRLPLQDYQVIGKLRLLQQNEVTPLELNLIKPALCPVGETLFRDSKLSSQQMPNYLDFTPPWTPQHHHLLPDEEDPLLITQSPTTSSASSPTTHALIGKRRPRPHFSHSSAKRKLLVRDTRDISDQLLMKIAKRMGSNSKWEEVGVALELDFATIQSVVGEGQTEHMKAFHVLQEWKRVAADRLTFERLATALEDAGLNSCAYDHCYLPSLEQDIED